MCKGLCRGLDQDDEDDEDEEFVSWIKHGKWPALEDEMTGEHRDGPDNFWGMLRNNWFLLLWLACTVFWFLLGIMVGISWG